MSFGFTPGSQLEIVKDLKGPSHAQGGVDIKLGKNGFSFARNGGEIKAAFGLVLPAVKAQDGIVLKNNDEPPSTFGKIKSILNFKNWGVNDYSHKKDFNTAYSTARNAGEKEFLFNGKRYNTNYKGTPEQQLKETGITNEQLQGKSELRDRMYKNLTPIDYNVSRMYNTIIKNEEEEDRQYNKENNKDLENIYRLYLGKPQINNSYKISTYKPTISKDDTKIYYSFSNINADKAFDNYNNWDSKYGDPDLITSFQLDKPFNNLVTRSNTFTLGKDARGSYISYYDKWDMNPLNLKLFNKEITTDVGRPIELYDRIYYKDYETGRKQMYYSDKELSKLDINKKNFDTLALQRELSNRGYKLPKSTKKDGSFDGIWGDETKKALINWQTKNKPK